MNSISDKRFRDRLVVLSTIVCMVILIFGYWLYIKEQEVSKDEKYGNLRAVSLLKSNQLIQWRHERLSEVLFFSRNLPYSVYAQEIIKGNNQVKVPFRNALKQIMTNKRYDNIFIISDEGRLLFSVDTTFVAPDSLTLRFSHSVFVSAKTVVRDFYFCNTQKMTYLDYITPIFNNENEIIAVMFFRIDAADFISPFVQEWPIARKTAETYLVKRDGDSLFVLSELRYLQNPYLHYGMPLSRTGVIAVKAAMGFEGRFEGTDYMGQKVLADVRKVPETDWYLVSQIYKKEIFSDLNERALYIATFSILAILLVTFIMAWAYHYRQGNKYKELYDAQVILEQKIRESEEKFRQLAENISDVVWIADLNLKLLYVSPSVEQLIGEKADKHLSRSIEEFMPPESIQKVKDIIREELQHEQHTGFDRNRSRMFELEQYRVDGSKVWVGINVSFIRNDIGEIVGYQGVTRDITELKKTEIQLRESEERFQLIMNNSIDAILLTKPDGTIISASRSAYEMVDLSAGKNALMPIGLLAGNNTINNEGIEHFINNLPEGELQIFETSYITKEGKLIPIEVFSIIVHFQNEKAVVSIARNIEQRKRDENIQIILHEIARTSTNAQAVDDLLILIRNELSRILDTRNFYVALVQQGNDVLRQINYNTGDTTPTEWNITNTLPGYVLSTGQTLLLNMKEQGMSFLSEHHLNAVDPEVQCWLGVPLIGNESKQGVIVFQSMTDANAYDQKSVKLAEMVAHEMALVFQRMKMVDDLIKAKEQAEEGDRLKMAFLSNISHEIRTPLNGILGFIDLLKKPNLDVERKTKFIHIMNESGQRLLETINNIVEISKIASGQMENLIAEVNIRDMMQAQLNIFSGLAESKGLTLVLKNQVEENKSVIRTDKYKLDGILTNLLSNALKFTRSGCVEFGNFLQEETLVFFVKDNGVGIPPDKLNIIFDRFIQADSSITRPYEGLGLGLSIVKAYVEAIDGKIWVDSMVNKGSTFFFSIPFEMVKNGNKSPFGTNLDLPVPIVILVAEDDPVSYNFFETLLEHKNITIMHTTDGQETVDLVKEHSEISLILMDIKMPQLNGINAIRQIRESNNTVPIIAQTAYAFEDDKGACLEAGCNEFISKPINPEELIRLIRKYTSHVKKG